MSKIARRCRFYKRRASASQFRKRVIPLQSKMVTLRIWKFFSACKEKKTTRKRQLKWRHSIDRIPLPRSFFRIVVLGAGGVGKTSLVSRFVKGDFSEQYTPTVEGFYEKSFDLRKGCSAFLEILDTAGFYHFPAMRRLTIQQGDAFILVYSEQDESSVEEVLRIQKDIYQSKGTEDVPMVLVRNKCDLAEATDKRRVSPAIASAASRGKNCVLVNTSAKFDLNVDGVFAALLTQIAFANYFLGDKKGKRKSSW